MTKPKRAEASLTGKDNTKVAASEDLPLASVVVASYNGLDMTRRCLDSLADQDYRPKEIIVVDNGSTEDIQGMVRNDFPDARLIRLESNLGFAGGYNCGIEAAQGRYIAIINNDAIASTGWLSALVAAVEEDDSIGAVASIIEDGNKPGTLDSCGVGIAFDGMSRQAQRGEPVPTLTEPMEVLMPSGCACLYRSEALDVTGLFDEDFFAYCEDTDLGLRLRWAGYRTVVAPGSTVTHYYSMTSGKFSLKKVYWVERNHLWVLIKNYPATLIATAPFVTVWRYLVQVYAVTMKSGDMKGFAGELPVFRTLYTLVCANIAALAGALRMLRKRLEFKPKRRINARTMGRIISEHKLSMYEIITGKTSHAGQ
ncbi:glycosyltransferase family 2 protein [Candidatus Latescibacterota bacterium]